MPLSHQLKPIQTLCHNLLYIAHDSIKIKEIKLMQSKLNEITRAVNAAEFILNLLCALVIFFTNLHC